MLLERQYLYIPNAEVRHQQFRFLLAFLGHAVTQDDTLQKVAVKRFSVSRSFQAVGVLSLQADLSPLTSFFVTYLPVPFSLPCMFELHTFVLAYPELLRMV